MYFFTILLPYTYTYATAHPPPHGSNLDRLAPNDINSLATGLNLAMDRPAPTEQSHVPSDEDGALSAIVIPNAENMDEEVVEALKELFRLAGLENGSLEPDERAFFLQREDVFGLAVALPGLLTQDQWNWIIGRPPHGIVLDAIRAEYGLNSVAEVVDRVNEDVESLTERQFELLLGNFHPITDEVFDTSGTLCASLSSPCLSTDGVIHAAKNNLLLLDGTGPLFRKAGLVHHSPERRQARRERTLQRIREHNARSLEEQQAVSRELNEQREVWLAGAAAAREERLAELCRWKEASSKLSDGQIAVMRRLRELGPEAVQQCYFESLGLVEGIES